MYDIAAASRASKKSCRQPLSSKRHTIRLRFATSTRKRPTLEGYLFPDTYRVARHTTAAQLCRQMTERFRKAWRQLGHPQADVHASVTLASLVEKEAKLPEERPLIASVFLNRLRIGMPLQCDPTTVYAAIIEQRYRGAIYHSDLDSKQVYNTYQHAGLPPGPIANPGLASLRAALDPAATDYLYFVARADGSGGHQFSKELTHMPAPCSNTGAACARSLLQYRRDFREAKQAGGIARLDRDAPAGACHGGYLRRAAAFARTRERRLSAAIAP